MNTRRFMLSLTAVGLLAACGGDESNAVNQQAYETVQEGSVAGVTSTIQGPGEVVPALTNTSVDTTTAFALDPNVVAQTPQQPGAFPPASSPSPSFDPAPASSYRTPEPQPAPRDTQPARTATQAPREPEREPVNPPPTSTAAPEPREPEPEPEPQPEPPPTTTTEEEPPPPPPTQTDTEGGSGME
jgi:hypothetical protein